MKEQNWIFTTDNHYLAKWNDFLCKSENGSFLQSIHRLNSYKKYGASFELMLYLSDSDEILMGSANIIIKFSIFKLYFCSFGPIVSKEYSSSNENQYLTKIAERSIALGCFALQATIPIYLLTVAESLGYNEDAIFDKITSQKYLNLISLKDLQGESISQEELISKFTSNGRRDIRSSLRKKLEARNVYTSTELKEAYACIELNGLEKGYEVRSWAEIGESLSESVRAGMSYVLIAVHEGTIQGAMILEISADTLHYTMGGVKRNTPDLLTGYFLQNEAITLAKKLNLKYYNISFGGPPSIQRFKSQFNPTLLEVGKTVSIIHNKKLYLLYSRLYSSKLASILMKLAQFKFR